VAQSGGPEREVQRQRVARRTLFPIRRDDVHLAETTGGLGQRVDPDREVTVVVRDKDPHDAPDPDVSVSSSSFSSARKDSIISPSSARLAAARSSPPRRSCSSFCFAP